MTQLNSTALRTRAGVEASVGAKLDDQPALSPKEAFEALEGPERVHWILGELIHGTVHGRFHIWIQRQAQRDFDGPGHVARLAPVAGEVDSLVGDLMAWTAERGRAVRAEERGEALISFVPLVWEPIADRVFEVFAGMVERWPEGLDPSTLPHPGPYARETRAPAVEGPRYPGVTVGFTESAPGYGACDAQAPSGRLAVETTALELWRHGASDAEIEAFVEAASGSDADLPAVLAAWVHFDGDGGDEERFESMRRAQDPAAAILGIESSVNQAVVRIAADRFEEIAEKLRPFEAEAIRPDKDGDFVMRTRVALRMGGVFLVVQAADMTGKDDVDLLWSAIQTGMTVVLAGTSPLAETLVERVKASGAV